MKKSILVGLGAIAMAVGAGVGLTAHEAVEAKADGYSGTIILNVATNWSSAACNVAAYLGNSDWTKNAWSSYETVALNQDTVVLSYESLSFQPEKVTFARYNPAYAESDWKADPWKEGQKYNEASGLDFHEFYVITDWGAAKQGPYIASDKASWGNKINLTKYKKNGLGHQEFYSEAFTFSDKEQFKCVWDGVWRGKGEYSASSSVASLFGTNDSNDKDTNVYYKADEEESFVVYFDIEAGTFHITNPYDIADNWAKDFLGVTASSDNCTYSKNNWSSATSSYEALVTASQNLLKAEAHVDHETDTGSSGAIVQAIQRYDYVIQRYGTDPYTDFIGRSGKIPSLARVVPTGSMSQGMNPTALLVGVVGAVALVSVGGFFFLHKRRED